MVVRENEKDLTADPYDDSQDSDVKDMWKKVPIGRVLFLIFRTIGYILLAGVFLNLLMFIPFSDTGIPLTIIPLIIEVVVIGIILIYSITKNKTKETEEILKKNPYYANKISQKEFDIQFRQKYMLVYFRRMRNLIFARTASLAILFSIAWVIFIKPVPFLMYLSVCLAFSIMHYYTKYKAIKGIKLLYPNYSEEEQKLDFWGLDAYNTRRNTTK